jgi:trans-2,3-dihydro-3-hydroxyanthranilate isomerase
VPVTTRSAVDSAVADAAALESLLAGTNSSAHGVFIFSAEPDQASTVYSRMFAPGLGIVEDPATGIASGPLGCYLVQHRIVPAERAAEIVSLQGAKMGRPSFVHISIDADNNGKIGGVRVGGEAVIAGEGTLYV